ncbi:hypothetical protein ACR9VJ_26365 [Streptomyces sp. H49]|uniref:hypothetical protein n=1 Tax=Streptomyces sp. H49 TaxID=3444117 RepID=UPI003F4ADB2C
MSRAEITAQQIQHLAGLAEAGAMDPDYARQAAENALSSLSENDRRVAEAILRDHANRR